MKGLGGPVVDMQCRRHCRPHVCMLLPWVCSVLEPVLSLSPQAARLQDQIGQVAGVACQHQSLVTWCQTASHHLTPQVYECPNIKACTYEGRTDALALYQDTLRGNTSLYSQDRHYALMCAQGWVAEGSFMWKGGQGNQRLVKGAKALRCDHGCDDAPVCCTTANRSCMHVL
jgi:hypothetical protein